jgi:hypothetical protein
VAVIELEYSLPSHFLALRGQRDGFVLLTAFLIAFLFIRTSARLIRSPKVPWWPGSVTTGGGLHLHHLVWGIALLLFTGFLEFALAPRSPLSEILAGAFGVGAGFTLDEFALWVRLKDVYWAEEGRASLDAVVVAGLLGGMILLGLAPFDIGDAAPGASLALTVAISVGLCVITILKGKPFMGLVGMFFPPIAMLGAARLAAPSCAWARWRYPHGGHKMARSRARFDRVRARRRRLLDAIGGAPGGPKAPARPKLPGRPN